MQFEIVEVLGSGVLHSMDCTPSIPVRYSLPFETAAIPLNDLLGRTLVLRFDGRITCQYCGTVTRKSYGDGYCYPCFKKLAASRYARNASPTTGAPRAVYVSSYTLPGSKPLSSQQ